MKKKKKLLSFILTLALLIYSFPMTAFAADYAPEDGDTLDISAFAGGDIITIGEGRSVILNGNSVALTNVRIICEAGVNLTLQNVIINNSSNSGACPLTFTGADSKLILENETTSTLTGGASAPGISVEATAELTLENNGTLTVKGGSDCAGLQCPDGANLTVSGSGTLNATGGANGAGIGGGNGQKSGAMTFLSGTVNATAGPTPRGALVGGAGIGGGMKAACGDITIEDGTITANGSEGGGGKISATYAGISGADIMITDGIVTATGYWDAPGIGGNSNGASTIMISGGTVNATSNRSGVGIGGFCTGGPKVTIAGGTIYSKGGDKGAGIGGRASGGGSVTISGGTVYAEGGIYYNTIPPKDIGPAADGTDGTLSITGPAMVFLKNNNCTTPDTIHINETYPAGTSEVYGTSISVTWTSEFGAYLRPCTLTYDANGGSSTTPDAVTRLYNTEITLSDSSGLSREGHSLNGWNTAPDGTGTNYAAGASYTMLTSGDILYAHWTVEALAGTAMIDDTTPEFGRTLTATLSGGNNTGTLSYQWTRNGVDIGSPTTSNTYAIVQDDIGAVIAVKITSNAQTGTLTSDPTSSVNKADCATATGITPVLDGKTHNSITLAAVADYEYLLVADGAAAGTGTWQESNVFTTLSASTAYDIYQRVKETATHKASETSAKLDVTTDVAPLTTYSVTFNSNGSDYATKTVNAGESIGSANFPSAPTRSSYSFGGWFTGENGTGTEFTSVTSVNETMTVYAKWTYRGGDSETTPAPTEKTITVTETSSEVFKDAAGTITAEANMDNAFSNSVEVKVTDTSEDTANFGFGTADEVYPFDISLYIKGTNEKTNPTHGYAVTISLPIPENLLDKKELLFVVHKSDSGVVTEITSRLVQKGGVWYLIFEATEFSPYALVARSVGSYDESAGVPYYLDANGNKVFIGFAANGKYIAPEGVTVSVMQNDKSFTDTTGHWAVGYIGFVTEREIFVGTGSNTFSPYTGMTRAMFATVIGRLYERSYGEIEASSDHAFTDCNYSVYYGKYIDWASENSIIGGVGDGKFAPDTLITREQMAAILYRFTDFLGVLPSGMDTALSFPDADSISDYAKTAALYCQTTGIIVGRTGGVFAPQETTTRAEVATILQRFVEVIMK